MALPFLTGNPKTLATDCVATAPRDARIHTDYFLKSVKISETECVNDLRQVDIRI